jgi:hypothetical protein
MPRINFYIFFKKIVCDICRFEQINVAFILAYLFYYATPKRLYLGIDDEIKI